MARVVINKFNAILLWVILESYGYFITKSKSQHCIYVYNIGAKYT